MGAINALLPYNCTYGSPLTFPVVTCRTFPFWTSVKHGNVLLVCRNGLHKHDFWEIIKSKIRHSYEAHTYLRHIGFARWFKRIESLFGGNWANGPSVRDKCPCQLSHGRERSISMYGEWWGETCPHWHVCSSLCMSGRMLRQSQGPRRVPREHAECYLSIVGHTNAKQRNY